MGENGQVHPSTASGSGRGEQSVGVPANNILIWARLYFELPAT